AGCTSSSGTITCTVSVSTSAGADVFSATTYDQPNGKGNVLGLGNVTVNAAANTTTIAPTTLAAASIGSVAVSVPMNVPEGVAATLPVVVVAKDTNGNTIIGSYASAITLSLTDASKATTLSATSLADSTS